MYHVKMQVLKKQKIKKKKNQKITYDVEKKFQHTAYKSGKFVYMKLWWVKV